MAVFVCVSAQVKVFVTGLFSLNQDIPAFKEHLRDFLVQIKVRLPIQLQVKVIGDGIVNRLAAVSTNNTFLGHMIATALFPSCRFKG